MDNPTAVKAGSRGDRADQLLADPLYIECFETVEADLRKRWDATSYKESDERENIWRMLKALEMVRVKLLSVSKTGEVARQSIVQKAIRAVGINSRAT